MIPKTEVALSLDARGVLCPIPVLRVSNAIKQLQVGAVLEVVTTDPGSKPDIEAWTRMTGNELLSEEEEAGSPAAFRFRIRRVK